MRAKFSMAGAVALATTLFVSAFGTLASGAWAQDRVATIDSGTVQFTAVPVIQPVPAASLDGDGERKDDASDEKPSTLAELVADQDRPGDLSSEMRCLASAIYFESRGETLIGQLAVGRVVVNRARSGRFPGSYCGVVYQPSQFSFVRGRSMPAVVSSSRDWREAVAIAQIAHEGSWEGPARGALYFHAARVAPGWRLTRLARVDNHIFYK